MVAGRRSGAHARRVAGAGAASVGPLGSAHGRGDRQPEREDDRERRPSGYDAGKRINGRKRHLTVDTEGSPIVLAVHSADVQDRDAAADVIAELLRKAPEVSKVFADGGYGGPKLRAALARRGLPELIEIVEKPKDITTFTVLPDAGLWRGRLPGWVDADAWPRTSNATRRVRWPGRGWPHAAFLMRRVARELSA